MLQICLALFESKINTIKLNLKMYHEFYIPMEVLSNSPIPTSRYFSNHLRMNTCSFSLIHSVVYSTVGSSNLEHTLSQYYTASIQRKYRLIKKPLGFFLANYFVKSIKPISWMKHVFLTQVLNFDKISCHTHWVIKFRFTAVTVRRRILWGKGMKSNREAELWSVFCVSITERNVSYQNLLKICASVCDDLMFDLFGEQDKIGIPSKIA